MSKTSDAAVRRAVAEGRAPSVSGYIERALAAFETEQSFDEFLSEWRATVGAPTASERAWAAEVVDQATHGSELRKPRARKVG